jgi:hypothetical protein
MERLRRGAEGVRRDPEPPAGPVIRKTRPLTCALSLFLQSRQEGGRSFFDVYPQSTTVVERRAG